MAVLDDLGHRSNVDCMALLNGTGVDDEEQPAIEAGDDGGSMPAIQDAGQASFVPPDVGATGWFRCYATLRDGTAWHKVWFDNCTGGTSRRRVFTNCQEHGCIKRKPTYGSPEDLLTAMSLWQRHASTQDVDRASHLSFWPSPADVQVAMPLLDRRPF